MDGPQEYEVESVTRARVNDKRGKKITWKYYVKWKGYDWDDSTWEPTASFKGGSEHILESFWERVDTDGRDMSDATAFKKGEELLVSGPPGKKLRKRKSNSAKTLVSPSSKDVPSSNSATISAPLLSSRKRQRVQLTTDDEWGSSRPKDRISTGGQRDGQTSTRPSKRRRASSPGPRKSTQKRQPSAGDSQLDADGETDPDVVEVEDELMQVSPEDAEEDTTETRYPDGASGIPNGSNEITFDDLEHFYSGNPIDIDQNTDDHVAVQKPDTLPQPQSLVSASSPPPTDVAPASPTGSSYDPLFDSPQSPSDKTTEAQKAPILPHHRARVAKPLVKLIDTTTFEGMSKSSRITAKARLMSLRTTDISSGGGSNGNVAERGGKPGPGRSSSGLITRNRSSLLTAAKGTLKSVKGKFGTTTERDQPDEIEEAPSAGEGDKLLVTSWSDEDVVHQDDATTSNFQPAIPPSGGELLKLAGLTTDPEPLPDYEDDPAAQSPEVKEAQVLDVASAPTEEPLNQSLAEVKEESKTSNRIADPSPSTSEAQQEASTPAIDSSLPPQVAPQVDEAVKKNIELAKEHLFPSIQSSFDSFNTTQSSFCSTIFGPLYQGSAANCVPATRNESSTTFKVTLADGVQLPLVLEDCSEITRMSDILIGKSSGSRVAIFYSAEDALAMVSTFKSDGTARVVLDSSAEVTQQDRFSTFLQRFQSFHTLIAPVGSEVCVLYSSDNADVAEKLGTPTHLRGLASTLLISHASIENQLAYVGAIMKAAAL